MENAEEQPMNKGEEEWCFYHQLGYAMSLWSLVEYQLYVIAALVLKPTDRYVLHSAYTGIESFRSKLAFVDRAIVKGVKDEQIKTDWTVMNGRVSGVSTKRNHLAHWTCVSYPQSPKSGRRIALEPTYRENEPGMRLEPPQDALCLVDINVISQEIYQLFVALLELCRRVAGKPEDPLVKSLVQPVYPPTIRELEDQMRVAFGRQPRPSRGKS